MFYNEIKATDNYLKSGVEQNEISKEYHDSLPEKRSSVPKTQNLGRVSPTFEGFDEKTSAALKSENHTMKHLGNSQHAVPITMNTCQKKDIPDVDGYFSDFTNDTDNDIEEEFDFD
ncbi:hypothetical protein GHT06_008237 [Daphnia sinensis]|uniref:Uncharacterized protein n=1 Tax=Daphnia sinensis TaxID=1820382 RepID=A0AAD5LUX4_9CRUS|nr:hypothetical protein GHT06_008237 [Daphnia sinensis]